MIGLSFAFAAFVLIACGLTFRRFESRVLAEILAAEQRQIERERVRRQSDANLAARWVD